MRWAVSYCRVEVRGDGQMHTPLVTERVFPYSSHSASVGQGEPFEGSVKAEVNGRNVSSDRSSSLVMDMQSSIWRSRKRKQSLVSDPFPSDCWMNGDIHSQRRRRRADSAHRLSRERNLSRSVVACVWLMMEDANDGKKHEHGTRKV